VVARWPSRDPIGVIADRNLYRFSYCNPVNFADPNGLLGIRFGENGRNWGWGDPTFVFNNDSWMDLANGAAATADGLIPFGDPFADLYQNGDIWSDDNEGLSDCERSLYEKSKTGGKVAQVCLTAAAGAGLWNAAKLPTLNVAVGSGSPFHVAYGSGGTWVHASSIGGRGLGSLLVTEKGAEAYVAAYSWFQVTGIPILSPTAALATGGTAATCVGGACTGFVRGWLPFLPW